MQISELQNELVKALADSAKASETLEKARLGLAPLESVAAEKQKIVNSLIAQFQAQTGATPVKAGRGGVRGTRAKYVQSNESKIAASGKRAYTRSINSG